MQTTHTLTAMTHEVSKSSFMTHLVPIQQFKSLLEKQKSEHPKANHYVTASRKLNELDQIVESFSDDGEPKGCAGMPTLKVLQGHDLINVGIITVRYFGGIKLGTGGMARAYGDAANLVIEHASLEPYTKLIKQSLSVSYSDFSKLEYLAAQHSVMLEDKQFLADRIQSYATGSQDDLEQLLQQANQLLIKRHELYDGVK